MGFKFVFPREKLDLNAILTLLGMRQGGFTPSQFLDWTLSAEFLSKTFKHFGGENCDQLG